MLTNLLKYLILFCFKIMYIRALHKTIGNVKIENLQTFHYRSLLTGTTYDLQKITNLDKIAIQKKSLDLGCIHLNVHCLPEENNVLDVFFGVNSAEECQLTCEYHSENCVMFTWFDKSEETFPSSCFLYSSCLRAGESRHSITGRDKIKYYLFRS